MSPETEHDMKLREELALGAEVRRLEVLEHGIAAAAVAVLVLASVRGLFNFFAPLPATRAFSVGMAIGVGIAVSLGLLAWVVNIRRRLDRCRRRVDASAFASDAVDREESALVDGHPYRAGEPGLSSSAPNGPSRLGEVVAMVGVLAAVVIVGGILATGAAPSKQRWTFLEPSSSPTDLDLHTSASSGGGPWTLEDHDEATGARALVNREGDGSSPPATIVAQSIWTRDFVAVTRCKTAAGRDAQQCGMVFRFRDDANYDVVRIDTVAKSVVLGAVVAGKERVLARAFAEAAANTWQELRLDARAGILRVSWNSRDLIEATESLPALGGRVGLWVPAAGIGYFDELSIDGLQDSPRTHEVLPLLWRPRS